MQKFLFATLSVLILTLTSAADDKKADPIDAKLLVGKWEPKANKEGATYSVEFTKDGKVTRSVTRDGNERKTEGTYKVEGNKLTLTMSLGGKDVMMVRIVSKLTADELTSGGEKGEEDTLVRVKDKK